jgi:hypothetical protein
VALRPLLTQGLPLSSAMRLDRQEDGTHGQLEHERNVLTFLQSQVPNLRISGDGPGEERSFTCLGDLALGGMGLSPAMAPTRQPDVVKATIAATPS